MALELVSSFAISSLLQELVDRIKATAADTFGLAYTSDIEMEIKNLEATYEKAQVMLDAVDGWDIITSKPRRDWVSGVRGACYEAEDFAQHLKLELLSKMTDASFLSSFFRKWGVSRKLRLLQSNLDSSINASNCHHNHGCTKTREYCSGLNKEPISLPDDASFRRKKDKDDIVNFFLNPSTSSRSSRIAIILGMFGIGKTTLAQVLKNDPRIQHHFNYRLWVSVSGDFDLLRILSSMIIDLQEEQIEELGSRLLLPPVPDKLSVTIRMFQGLCMKKKVLIVLDDLCRFMKPRDWEDFKSVLEVDASGIFGVIITTRNPKVASMVASLSSFPTLCHELQILSNEDCASLILGKAYSVTHNNPSKRKSSGKTALEIKALHIAEKFCKGLPLVADIIRHRLSYEPEVKWADIDLWDMPEFKNQIFPAFRLNYSHLSIFLKNCLPYFTLFPESYNFSKNELVQLWMAEGLIRPQVAVVQYLEYPGLEELGSYAFDEVLSQSILQIYCPFSQEPQIYKMHEFIRRYAQYIGSDMYARISYDDKGNNVTMENMASQLSKARHLSFMRASIPPEMWKHIEKCEGLRTILSLQEFTKIGQLSYTLFLRLQWLRVLVLQRTDIHELPESLGKLKHLGLLDVSETEIEELPISTTDLCRLQVLKLNRCYLLLRLPKEINNLTRLLHLEVNIKGLGSMPPHIGKLFNLRTLRAFIVGRKDGHRITELKNMKYLEGSICLTNLENVKDEEEAKEAMLSDKSFLKRVELEWNGCLTHQSLSERIFDAFEPHENLQELQVTEYSGAQFPNWLTSPECKLTSIHLLRCNWCISLPALGQLQCLKNLHIEEMHMVRFVDHQFLGNGEGAGFPLLESLRFQDMMNLEKWEGLQTNQMPRLCDLVITDCPKLTSLPSLNLLTSLLNLEINTCPMLEALPEEGLPLSLEKLIIVRCDSLKQCCLQEGADWQKIKAIPNILIDFKQISSPES